MNLETIRTFIQSLDKNRVKVLNMTGSNVVIDELKNIVDELEASVWDKRSQEASSHLKDKSEEDRRMLLMSAKEKKFFLKYKAENPDNKWDYFEDYAKEVSQDFSKSLDK